MTILVLILIYLFISRALSEQSSVEEKKGSPLYQGLPNCLKGDFVRIKKKTTAKAIVCPMFKDEEGFLSEWVAYYQMHGFEHVYLFNDGSIDNSLKELKPWIDSGFVTIRSNFTADSLHINPKMRSQAFKAAMATKALLETECKLEAIRLGYDYQLSLDLDEYVVPNVPGVTVVDELHRWMTTTGRHSYCIDKLNFQQSPHTLEPINLLTIEAYQTRMQTVKKMSYYTSVAPKCGYRLKSPEFTNMTAEYIARCCHFHGCQKWDFTNDTDICSKHHNNEGWRVSGAGKKWMDGLYINHYSRSLEKFALKQKTWKTSSGEVRSGEDHAKAASSYDLPKFFSRSLGWYHDATALRYSCQLREHLSNMTQESPFLRPGSFWYRNPEFGKYISDPDKRGRYGRPNAPGFKYIEKNSYNYHGGVHGDKSVDHSVAEKERIEKADGKKIDKVETLRRGKKEKKASS